MADQDEHYLNDDEIPTLHDVINSLCFDILLTP